MLTRNYLFAKLMMLSILALAGACDDGSTYSMEPQEPAAILIEEERSRADMLAEYRRWRDDLATLKGPGGSEYARQWGVTLPEAKAQARAAIRFWSTTLGPWPENGEAAATNMGADECRRSHYAHMGLDVSGSDEMCLRARVRPPGGGGDDDDPVPPDEDYGVTCWWFQYDDGDHGGWWVCEREY